MNNIWICVVSGVRSAGWSVDSVPACPSFCPYVRLLILLLVFLLLFFFCCCCLFVCLFFAVVSLRSNSNCVCQRWIKVAVSPSHSTLTPDHPAPAQTLWRHALCMAALRVPTVKSLVWLTDPITMIDRPYHAMCCAWQPLEYPQSSHLYDWQTLSRHVLCRAATVKSLVWLDRTNLCSTPWSPSLDADAWHLSHGAYGLYWK